ncbi:MAG: LAGLIDADG family homing endonuclease, partial [Nanoarchaeota archaeon]
MISKNNNQKIQSKAEKMYKLIEVNPDLIFNLRKICQIYNYKTMDRIKPLRASTIISRLYQKGWLFRTKTQLKNGYLYTLNNKNLLDSAYDNYLLPYDFENREDIIKSLTKNNFGTLRVNERISSYTENYSDFLAMNVGFLMCDGHIKKNLQQINYFFNQKDDAELFTKYFLSVFSQEKLSLAYHSSCFRVGICNKSLASLFNSLGVPTGNKVYKPFLVPKWIYYGSDKIKSTFLSTIYGNEGSKPQNNKFRIQFVLSKNKDFVPNLLEFLNQVRSMLNHFGISTSHIQLRKQKRRAFCGRFYIKGKDNLVKFYNKIGFLYA